MLNHKPHHTTTSPPLGPPFHVHSLVVVVVAFAVVIVHLAVHEAQDPFSRAAALGEVGEA